MADLSVDISKLPDEIRDKLAELDLELSEGDITQKGYEKKRTRLLTPYIKQPPLQAGGPPARGPRGDAGASRQLARNRRTHRRVTHNEKRYHSDTFHYFRESTLENIADIDFPDINEIFNTWIPTLDNSTADVKTTLKKYETENVTFDIENMNLKKIRRNLEKLQMNFDETNQTRRDYADLNEDNQGLDIKVNDMPLNNTRRQIAYWWWPPGEWNKASRHFTRVRATDAMLQVIYMARHKIRDLESQKFFNSKDTSYRIAFIYRRLRKMWKKFHDIYTQVWVKMGHTFIIKMSRMHHRIMKIYTDFTYLWWVLVRLHESFCQRNHIIMTKPPPTEFVTQNAHAMLSESGLSK